ncbi:MAG: PaaI family thioesterase [Phycisphaerales bacterium JB063]
MAQAHQPADPDYAQRVRDIIKQQPLMNILDMTLVDARPGDITIRVQHRDDLQQHHGYLHGGITALLADEACGLAGLSLVGPRQSVVTTDLHLSYLRPGVGVAYVSHATVVRAGRKLSTCRCDVHAQADDGSQKLIAIAQASLMTLEHP